jgi:aminodeoxyfutalosine synthase
VVEEQIYHDAGARTPQAVQRAELVRWIQDAGRVPVERDTLYNEIWSAAN